MVYCTLFKIFNSRYFHIKILDKLINLAVVINFEICLVFQACYLLNYIVILRATRETTCYVIVTLIKDQK